VIAPITAMAKIMAQQSNSQQATARSWRLGQPGCAASCACGSMFAAVVMDSAGARSLARMRGPD
jgi:hypothetical protein